jgi:hypothetical protein
MAYAQKNYPQIQGINGRYPISKIGCFVTAYCNLFADFGITVDPLTLNNQLRDRGIFVDVDDGIRDDLGWNSATRYDSTIVVGTIGVAGQWPDTNQAIVKFHYQSISEPWITVHGKRIANMISHFCKVADWRTHTIVDSWDGVVKPAGVYGAPVGYATFFRPAANPAPAPTPAAAPTPPPPGYFTVVKPIPGYSTSANAANRRASNSTVPPGSYAIFNEAHAMLNVTRKPGVRGWWVNPGDNTASAPAPAPGPATIYELLDAPRAMHVKKPGGAEKWSFGNVQKWADFSSSGHYPENTNADIVAIAHVPVAGVPAAYYMDALALGDYRSTGRVAFTIGFNWNDMGDGHYEPPKAIMTPPVAAQPASPQPVAQQSPNLYKTSYAVLNTPARYIARETATVHELDGRRPDRQLLANMAVVVAGTFTNGGVLYARPAGSAQSGYWFGIPMTNLIAEDELYNTKLDLPTKAAINQLSAGERLTVWLSKVLSQYTRFIGIFKKNKNKG